MKKLSASIPISSGEHLRRISEETAIPIPTLVRMAIQEFIERYHLRDS
jgi:hypothetical protein